MKKCLSIICSLFVAVFAIGSSFLLGNVYTASALSSSVDVSSFPLVEYASGVNRDDYETVIESLKQNESIADIGDCYILLNVGNRCEFYIFKEFTQVKTVYDGYYAVNVDCYIPSEYGKFENIEKAAVASYNFALSEFSYNDSRVLGVLPSSAVSFPYMPMGLNQSDQIYDHSPNVYCFYSSVTPPYTPDFSGLLVGFPAGLEFSVSDFFQWLVDNDKIAVSVDSGGAAVGGKIPSYIGMSKLKSFLEFYKQFGSSSSSFVSRIGSWFAYMNIANQTNDNVVILKNTIDSLYREYINSYKHEFYSESANQAHHRRNVNTQTTDDDLTLVTDDANDDIYTTLLREIIRGIVALQSSTISGIQAVIDTLNNLDFSVNVSNNGGVIPNIDLSSLYNYDSDAFEDDLQTFVDGIEDVQDVPQGYIDTINQNALMPENMLSDKSSLTVNIPTIAGFTISDNGNSYSTQTGTYALSSSDYPWLDPIVQKIKRFASIILIMGYLVHLRYRIPELVRGE